VVKGWVKKLKPLLGLANCGVSQKNNLEISSREAILFKRRGGSLVRTNCGEILLNL